MNKTLQRLLRALRHNCWSMGSAVQESRILRCKELFSALAGICFPLLWGGVYSFIGHRRLNMGAPCLFLQGCDSGQNLFSINVEAFINTPVTLGISAVFVERGGWRRVRAFVWP